MNPIDEQGICDDLFGFIGRCVSILWKDWPRDMKANSLPNGQPSLSGTCPYPDCARPTVFIMINGTQTNTIINGYQRMVAIMQCQGCQNYILTLLDHPQNQMSNFVYRGHYPLGAPDQAVADEIPDHIKADFQEALRCLFVEAFNATVEMCRRALEATCLDLGAPKSVVLEDMIDWLETKRIITPPLKDAAHKVRLGGNRGAHPPAIPASATGGLAIAAVSSPAPALVATAASPISVIEKEHAEAIVDFTRHFFHHVYVVPKQLDKYDFSKPKVVKSP